MHIHMRDIAEKPSGLCQPDCILPSLLRSRKSCECMRGGMKTRNPEHLQSPYNCFHSSSKGLYSLKLSGLSSMALYCLKELPKMTFKPPESQTLFPSLSELRPGGPWTQVISETHLSWLAATSQPELGM